jgi:hypothetical protein
MLSAFYMHLHTGGVTGSIPVPPTIKTPNKTNGYNTHREICKYRNNARTRTHYPRYSGQNLGSKTRFVPAGAQPVCPASVAFCSWVNSRYPENTRFVATRRAK